MYLNVYEADLFVYEVNLFEAVTCIYLFVYEVGLLEAVVSLYEHQSVVVILADVPVNVGTVWMLLSVALFL